MTRIFNNLNLYRNTNKSQYEHSITRMLIVIRFSSIEYGIFINRMYSTTDSMVILFCLLFGIEPGFLSSLHEVIS